MFEGIAIDCRDLSPDTAASLARESIREHRLAYLRGFPLDVDIYVSLLEQLGDPCANYAAGSDSDVYALHPVVNVVRCRPAEPEKAQRVQEKAGAFRMHSGRSFALRRPQFLAMLMVDAGWTDLEPGRNGESLIVRWGDVVAAVQERYPAHWAEDFRLLVETSVCFPPSHVDEEPSALPVVYVPPRLRPTAVPHDVAARIPQDLNRLRRVAEHIKNGERWLEAVERFVTVANDPEVTRTYRMSAGDVVVIDNDRFGHGRHDVVASRTDAQGERIVNPRTIWSVNVE